MPSGVTFSGLATGIDTAALVTQLMSLERIPADALRTQQSALRSQSTRLGDIRTKLLALRDAARGLDTRVEGQPMKASSSGESVVRATARDGAAPAVIPVHVTSLAAAERTYSDAFSAANVAGAAGAGTFTIQVGLNPPTVITIEATDTLADVVGRVNASGAAVTASLVYDGLNYRIQIAGTRTGAAQAIEFSESGTSLGLATPANQVQAASDAVFSIDGFAMTRPQNQVTDAIEGVTLDLVGVSPSPSPTEVRVSRDPAALKSRLDTFVSAYNSVSRAVSSEFQTTTAQGRGASSLQGDSTLRTLQARLRSLALGEVGAPTDDYRTLASIGVSIGRTGELSIDAAKLDAAVAEDPSAVATVLAGADSLEGGVMSAFDDFVGSFTSVGGAGISARMDAISTRVRGMDDRIAGMERRLELYETSLRSRFAALEELVSGLQAQGSQITAILSSLTNS